MKALPMLLLLAVLACGPATKHTTANPPPAGTFLITAEQIEKSGAHTAWQVLKQNAPMLALREDRNGRPASMGRRGRTSFLDRKSTRLNSSHITISYAVFCLKQK